MKHLALQISTVVAVLLSGTAAYAQQKTLYERLGGVFAIAAVVNDFSDAVVKNPSLARDRRTLPSGNGTPKIWADFRGSNSCARCGSATLRVDPSNIQRRNQAILPLVWKPRIAN